jgi:hypothetical protein
MGFLHLFIPMLLPFVLHECIHHLVWVLDQDLLDMLLTNLYPMLHSAEDHYNYHLDEYAYERHIIKGNWNLVLHATKK